MEIIMQGAIDRLRKYAGINGCPIAMAVTHYTNDRQDMWLYTLKVWMEKRRVTLDITYPKEKQTNSILEECKRVDGKKEIWKWITQTGITQIQDMLHVDGSWREDICKQNIATIIQGQIATNTK